MKTKSSFRRAVFLICVFTVLSYAHDFLKLVATRCEFSDTAHYYLSSMMLREGLNVWDQSDPEVKARGAALEQEMKLREKAFYPPLHSLAFFLFFLPLTYLPYHAAALVWVLFNNLAFFAGIMLLCRYFGERMTSFKSLGAFFLAYNCWFLRENMVHGQPNMLIFFFLAAGLYFLKIERPFLCGLSIALAIVSKEIVLFVLVFFLWQKRFKEFIALCASLLVFKITPLLFFGFQPEVSYLRYQYFNWAQASRGVASLSIGFNEVIKGMFQHVLPVSMQKILFAAVCSCLCILFYKIMRASPSCKTRQQDALRFSVCLVFSLLVSPWLHEMHLIFMILPLLVIWFVFNDSSQRKYGLLFAFAYMLIALKYSFRYAAHTPMVFLTGTKTYASVLVFFVLSWFIKRDGACRGR